MFSLPVSSSTWFTHSPQPVIENESAKLLWDFSLVSEGHHSSNRPDLVLFDYSKRTIMFIEIFCPADINVLSKECEKIHEYQPLARDFHSVYRMSVDVIPVVIGHTGVVSSQCKQHLQHIPEFSISLLCHLQKAAILGTIHVLHSINL